MECVSRPLLGAIGPFRFQMSLVLDKLPAGTERTYTVAKRELRALARLGRWRAASSLRPAWSGCIVILTIGCVAAFGCASAER